MCRHGDITDVHLSVPRAESGRQTVPVDSCIANFIQWLNSHGVETKGCCCGHEEGDATLIFSAKSVWNWMEFVGKDHNLLLQQATYLLEEFTKEITDNIYLKSPPGQPIDGMDVTWKRCKRLIDLKDKAVELLEDKEVK